MQPVSLADIWRTAWQRFEKHWVVALLLMIGFAILGVIPYIGNVLLLIGQAILTSFALKAWDLPEKPSNYNDLFPQHLSVYLKIFLFYILPGLVAFTLVLAFTGGAMLLFLRQEPEHIDGTKAFPLLIGISASVLLGLIMQVLFFSYPFIIVEKDAPVIEAIRQSYQITKDNLGTVVLYFLTAAGINLLGALACCIGLLISSPLTLIASAGLYRTLSGSSGTSQGTTLSRPPQHI